MPVKIYRHFYLVVTRMLLNLQAKLFIMTEIWKFPIIDTEWRAAVTYHILMPVGAEILSVQLQNGNVVVWAVVQTDAALEKRNFQFFYTGEEIFTPPAQSVRRFLATIQLSDGIVLHAFEVIVK